MDTEFDYILKAKEQARKVVEYYKDLLKQAKDFEIPYTELRNERRLRKIAAIDGGERKKDLIASSIIVVRGGGGIFEPDKKIKHLTLYDIFITSMSMELDRFSHLIRDITEFKTALRLLDEDPEVLIMDGSLSGYITVGLPNRLIGRLSDKKFPDQVIRDYFLKYNEYLRLYDRILKRCHEKKILLMGVSKDSRVHYISDYYKLNMNLTDYSLLKLGMKKSGVTKPIPIELKWQTKAIPEYFLELKILSEEYQKFNIIYFKLKDHSIPVRVDFPDWQSDRLDEIMSIMETYHDSKGFILTSHLVHNWAVMKEHILNGAVNAVKEEVLRLDPEIYDAIFSAQRREEI